MTTNYLREKIATLNNLIQSEELNLFQYELVVEDADVKTGDAELDKQMGGQAANAKTAMKAIQRRLDVRTAKLQALQQEFDAQQAEVKAT